VEKRFTIFSITVVVLGVVVFAAALFLKGDQPRIFLEKMQGKKLEERASLQSGEKPRQFFPEEKAVGVFGKKAEELVSIVFVGDIMLSRIVDAKMRTYNNYFYPFEETAEFLRSADITFGNLETTITPGQPIESGQMLFRADPRVAVSLKEAGFDILSLANNHTLNFGKKGLIDTFKYLNEVGVEYVGAGNNFIEAHQPVIKEVHGIKVGFLAYTYPAEYQANFADHEPQLAFWIKEKMVQDVVALKEKADFLVVSMHAGGEYRPAAHPSQVEFARAAIDAGADLVIGHHPHVVQNAEIYNGKYIFYSLGNFIFDQMWSEETREGLVLKVIISKNGLSDISFYPIKIYDYSQPKFLIGESGKYILDRLKLDLEEKKAIHYEQGFQEDVLYGVFSEEKRIVSSSSKEVEKDLSGDGVLEKISLTRGQVSLFENRGKIWESSKNFWIDSFKVGDINNDGQEDLVLSLWKRGNFGSSMPFWVKENDQSIKNHLFIYTFKDNNLKLIWGSSNLPRPLKKMEIADVDNDNKNELLVLEGDYDNLEAAASTFAVYKWQGFSIVQEKRFKERTSDFNIEVLGKKSYIILR